jgi:argininosuccinate lyase
VGHLYVPDEFVQISSIMPQKRNPVAMEHIRIQASLVVGLCEAVISSLHNTPFTDMNDAEDPLQAVAFQALTRGARCVKLIAGFAQGLKVQEKRVQRRIAESFVTITELADSLVRTENVSFRTVHEICSILVRTLLERERTLDQLDYGEFRRAFQDITGREPTISPEQLLEFVHPAYFIQVRNIFGGPGPEALSANLERYSEQLQAQKKELAELEQRQGSRGQTAAGGSGLAAIVNIKVIHWPSKTDPLALV